MSEKERNTIFAWIAGITAVVFVVVGAGIWYAASVIKAAAEETCKEQLADAASTVALGVRSSMTSAQKHLRGFANVISFLIMDHFDHVESLVSYFSPEDGDIISRMELLLPDGRLLQPGGVWRDMSGQISFDRLAAKGDHISSRTKDINGELIVRICVPVAAGGSVQAVLCGIVRLDTLRELFRPDLYDGQAQLYVIEANSGCFLVDTWHDSLSSVADLGYRPTAPGTKTAAEADNDMKAGRSGTIVFTSRSIGEYLYCQYEPVGIEDWTVMLSVAEGAVFADSRRTSFVMNTLAVSEGMILTVFFLLLFVRERKYARLTERRLGQVEFILAVEKLLRRAPRNGALFFEQALKVAAAYLEADTAFMLVFDGDRVSTEFTWQRHPEQRRSFSDGFPALCSVLKVRKSVLRYGLDNESAEPDTGCGVLRRMGIKSIMVVPLLDMDGAAFGVLGAADIAPGWESAQALEVVTNGFSLAYSNMKAFRKYQELGTVDSLTGLWNRNKYQLDIHEYEQSSNYDLVCVYADADGLHSLNNEFGHEAGDRMLKTVAGALQDAFTGTVYRIGGDEFVAFSVCGKEEMFARLDRVRQAVQAAGYHISAGAACRCDIPLIEDLIRAAERAMYEEKARYYAESGTAR